MPDRPNLVFVMPDQLRADFLGCYGADFVPTPNVDRLAARGVRFGQAYSQHPVCVPARASLLLGQHALRTGVLDNPGFIRPDYRAAGLSTWPELLNERGYYTAAIGKMHFYPWDARFGFQYRRIAEDKRWLNVRDDYWHTLHEAGHRKYHGDEHDGYFERQGAIVNKLPWELQPDHWVGQEAVRFIRDHGKDGPFAMMVGFPGPHCPYDPAPEFLDGIDPDAMPEPVPNAGHTPRLRERTIAGNKNPWNRVDYTTFPRGSKLGLRAHYAALVRQIDVAIGWILEELERQGLADNTVVILSSDHGDALGDHDLIGKAQFYDSAWHVPMIASAPWLEQGTVREELVALTDVTATMLRLGGVDVPSFMDSRPLPGLGIEGATGRDHLFGALGTGLAIQRDGWRLAKYATGETVLFDLTSDPAEQVNRLDDPSAQSVRDRLEGELTTELLALVQAGHVAQRVDVSWQSDDFGREGWQRPYPRPVAR